MFRTDVPSHVHERFFTGSYTILMEYATLVEIVSAMHLTRYVQSPFPQRGGLMLVAPPGAFKTTIAETMDEYSATQVISDMNVQTLVGMKEQFLSQNITTLAFSDFAKLYKRHGSVASNMEGIIMALAEEGFRKPSWLPQTTGALPARCAIIAGMTESFFNSKVKDWEDNGFLRRFLFARYIVSNIEIMEDAVSHWRKAVLDGNFSATIPASRTISYTLSREDVRLVTYAIRHQHNKVSASIMLQKIFCVLRWKFASDLKKANFLIRDFMPCLSKRGGELILKEKKQ